MSSTSKPPVAQKRLGSLKAAIWMNETKNGLKHNVTLTKLYKGDDEKWQEATSFGRDDLLPLRKLLDQAHTWILQEQQSTNDQSD